MQSDYRRPLSDPGRAAPRQGASREIRKRLSGGRAREEGLHTVDWNRAFTRALVSGSLASVLSGVALAICGKIERNAPAGPLNGPSQWVWGHSSAHRRRFSWRTVAGYSIHHLVSIGWATLYEKHVASLTEGRPLPVRLLGAGATGALACFADFRIARGRLQPGFEKQLSRTSLALVYAAFALGLSVHARPGRRVRSD
jgi:hypothetical protein